MRLEIQIDNVVVQTAGYYFIAVQLEYRNNHTPPVKLRTDLAKISHRPKFKRNLFTFDKIIENQILKFGLMSCQNGSQDRVNHANPIGIGSISIDLNRLKELSQEGELKMVIFLNKKKEVGQFKCLIRFKQIYKKSSFRETKVQLFKIHDQFSPLVSRVLYNQEATKDHMKMENNIKKLQKQSQMLYDSFKALKNEEQTLEKIYSGLEKDEEQLKNEIQLNQKINQKIYLKMSQRESSQALKLEIDMLRNSDEGKGLLLEKLQYYEGRIKNEKQEHINLSVKYDKVKEQLDERIKKAENYAQKLKGKQLQLFQITKNRQILKKIDDVEYQFYCNQQIIQQLVKKAKNNQMSADQANFILSQVNHNIKLEEVENRFGEQDDILSMIEKQADKSKKISEKDQTEQEKIVLRIKLEALEQQITAVKQKIQKTLSKRHLKQSYVRPL